MCCGSLFCWRKGDPFGLDFEGDARFQQVELKRVEKKTEETEGAGLGYGQRDGGVWGPGERQGQESSGDEPGQDVGSS